MNSLMITLCILITAETEILLATNSSTIMRPRELEFGPVSSSNPNFAGAVYTSSSEMSTYNPQSTIILPLTKYLYNYNYNTDTGIQAQERGYLKNVGTNQEALEAQGRYSYTGNEGNTFQISYLANENGFQPKGAHLPTVPPLIKKALQYIAEHSEENGKE